MVLSPAAVSVSSQVVATAQLRELASGVDALYLSARGVVPPELVRALDRMRDQAAATEEPTPITLGPLTLGVAGHGLQRYKYLMLHEFGRVGVTPSSHLPAFRIQPRAEFIAAVGAEEVVAVFREVLGAVGEFEVSVSRADLYADFQDWSLKSSDRRRFVSRSRKVTTHEEHGALTGLSFGTRSGGGISARIYDKTGQAKATGTDWVYSKWGAAYKPGRPVFRVEFEFGRTALREFSVDSPEDLFGKVSGLWGYATDWLSLRDPSTDETRSRWPISTEWAAVQQATLRDDPVSLSRVRESRTAIDERRLVPGLCGYLSSFAAVRDLGSLSDALDAVGPVLRDWERETGIPFTDRIAKKRHRREWGL